MRGIRVWARLLGFSRTVVEDVTEAGGELVVSAGRGGEHDRCGISRPLSRGSTLGRTSAVAGARSRDDVPFRRGGGAAGALPAHGVMVSSVPWARHGRGSPACSRIRSRGWRCNSSKTAVAELMRVAWRTVGADPRRVAAEAMRGLDLLDGLRRIGIDEISHRKGSGT